MQDSAEEKEERKGQEWSAPCYFDISIMGCGDSFGDPRSVLGGTLATPTALHRLEADGPRAEVVGG